MKQKILIIGSIVFTGLLSGCNSAPSDMTPEQVEALKHPSKTIPKEAAEGMAHMGDLIQKQKEENARKGVDSQGLPIKKGMTAPAGNEPAGNNTPPN